MKNIVSASRRTDIPKFYYNEFQNLLKQEKIVNINPYNNKEYTISLKHEDVNAIVMWSKDYSNFINNVGVLDEYNLYFQYTITKYGKDLEPNVSNYNNTLKTIEKMRLKYNPKQFNFRFDPILFTDTYTSKERLESFNTLCKDLRLLGMNGSRITTSYISLYGNVQNNLNKKNIKLNTPKDNQLISFFNVMGDIAKHYGFQLYSCSNPLLLECSNIKKAHCIDGDLLSEIFGDKFSKSKDRGQRLECGCHKSKDIGNYSLRCKHDCLYCYSNAQKII